ncbi:DUF1015 family protein [Nonomuraea sp. NPDC049649]|uniref:DUF1015 family protein n=1 Tax=Nonomuraea sp. NPDC049649 TaxID=3155776 RepID=UPI003436208D
MGNSELPIPDGLILRPFRGVRFAVDDPAKVTSPPYDLISEGDVRVLLDTHPNNVVRLILPGTPGSDAPGAPHDPADPKYAQARRTLEEWRESGILVADEEPALYVYEQRGPGVLQRGLIGDVCLPDPAQRIILPHEDVVPGPIADRLALMTTTRANLEPIFLLYNGQDGTATRLVDEVATSRTPLVTAHTEDGLTHRLWAITDEAEIAAINADLHPRQALIADGHHRYATYRILQRREHALRPAPPQSGQNDDGQDGYRQNGSAQNDGTQNGDPQNDGTQNGSAQNGDAQNGDPQSGGGQNGNVLSDGGQKGSGGRRAGRNPWDYGMALLVDTDAYPPDLKAIHRVIPELPLDEAVAKAKGSWRVQDFNDLDEGMAALDAAEDPAFLLASGSSAHLLSSPDPLQLAQSMPADRSARWNSLNTSILTEFVLPKVWGLRDDEETVRIVHHDARAAVELAAATGGTAVILKPLAVADVLAVAAGGERVPRKSTSFGPKPRTGLILRIVC